MVGIYAVGVRLPVDVKPRFHQSAYSTVPSVICNP